MGLIEERDPAFWARVIEHPDVAPHVLLGTSVDLAKCLEHPAMTPLRAVNGGFLFYRMDNLGFVQELHTMFTPEGWGREVLFAAKDAFREMFRRGTQLVVTYEIEGWWRSRPPRSFRFAPAADFAPTPYGALKIWTLTRDAWELSPANRT